MDRKFRMINVLSLNWSSSFISQVYYWYPGDIAQKNFNDSKKVEEILCRMYPKIHSICKQDIDLLELLLYQSWKSEIVNNVQASPFGIWFDCPDKDYLYQLLRILRDTVVNVIIWVIGCQSTMKWNTLFRRLNFIVWFVIVILIFYDEQ